jgi:hypothetical protein
VRLLALSAVLLSVAATCAAKTTAPVKPIAKKLLHPKPVTCATCLGADPCRACKTCRYCAHCARNGGTCGVCKPK